MAQEIVIKNHKNSTSYVVQVSLYNNEGRNLRIDIKDAQIELNGISVFHAKRMIKEIEKYIKMKEHENN